MPFPECKIYFDGSHYIAIPHTVRKSKKRIKDKYPPAPVFYEENRIPPERTPFDKADTERKDIEPKQLCLFDESTPSNIEDVPFVREEKTISRKELFENAYKKYYYQSLKQRKELIIKELNPYFKDKEKATEFVNSNLLRKKRNLICRRIRMTRKANLQEFNYFCTFTYNDALHNEETFKKSLKSCLARFSTRKGWKYIGVWERAPKTERLHFHGIFNIPENTMPGYLLEMNDFNFNTQKMQITHQNTYFNEKFGRSDFEKIQDKTHLGEALAYLMKYIEKSGEKIVYSKGLAQYFISDIMDEDIVCPIGVDENKLLLFDDFTCWDNGSKIGTVNKDTISKLRKSN